MNITDGIKFLLECPKPSAKHLHNARHYTLQTVVNIGWCKDAESLEWIRKGDFMSAQSHRLLLNNEMNSYVGDVDVACYGKLIRLNLR